MFDITIDNTSYTIALSGNYIILQNNTLPADTPCKKNIKVVQDFEFTYKLQKTQIRAYDGAPGLYEFLERCYKKSFMECNANKVIRHMITMKGAK